MGKGLTGCDVTRQFRVLIRRQNRPGQSDGRTDRQILYGKTGPAGELKCRGRFSSPTDSGYDLCILIHVVHVCVCLWPLDAEKSDGGRREKWREKDKTTVGWRAFEVLKPRSWEPNAEGLKPRSWDPGLETSRWGPETQVLRSRSWNLALRAWNPGPESQVLKPRVEGLKPRIEVLKPRSSERACVINWLKQLTGTH
jgi:hypothetical protein